MGPLCPPPEEEQHPQGSGLTDSQEVRGSGSDECRHLTLEAGGTLALTTGESGEMRGFLTIPW